MNADESTIQRSPHTPWPRLLAIGVALAAGLSVLLVAFLWPNVTASVKGLPIALVGPSEQTSRLEKAFEAKSPGTFHFTAVTDRSAAVDRIETRKAHGAIVIGQKPEVLTASAASPVVAQLLTGLAPALQAQLNAAAAAQGIALPITVAVTDVVPLASTDARGAAMATSSFPLVLGGMIGGIAISLLVVGVWRRITALLVYSAVGALGITGILQGWFGALQGDFLVNAGAVALALLAIGGVIVGFAALVGPSGVAIGPVLFLLVANPISSAAQPLEFLAAPWGVVGQWFPPGAAATLIRDVSYFPAADVTFPWLVLAGWAALGLVLAAVGHFRDRGAALESAVEEAPAPVEEPVPA
ncbi:ABC transporter permease [Lacisediminihabitans sp.]|uniref:ABC transporter permease n=1 Tax=Lacisediminihabitans sp. TaxID=2787631 RepID=UPI00374CE8D2